MENLFQFLIDLFVFEFSIGLWLWALVGFVVAGCGVFVLGISMLYLVLGKRVQAKVVKLHEKARKIDDDDSDERKAEKLANPVIKAELEILDGPYKGVTKISGSGSSKSTFAVGDVTAAYYTPLKGGDIVAARELVTGFKLAFWLIFFGMGFVLLLSYISKTMAS